MSDDVLGAILGGVGALGGIVAANLWFSLYTLPRMLRRHKEESQKLKIGTARTHKEVIERLSELHDPCDMGILVKVALGDGDEVETSYAELLMQDPCGKCGKRPGTHLAFHYYAHTSDPNYILGHFCNHVYHAFESIEAWKKWNQQGGSHE